MAGFDPSSTLPGHVPGLAGTDLTGKPQIGRNRAQSLGRAHSEIGLSPVRGRVAERVAAGGRRGAPSKSKKIGVRHGVLEPCVFGVTNAGNVKNGIGLPKRHGGTHRSQSGEVAGVVRGLEAPGAHPGRGARGL